jgi:hypothetical protein
LLEEDLEIQCVLSHDWQLFLELISIPILKNGIIFRYNQILREEDVKVLLEERNETWALDQVEVGLNVQVMDCKTELVDILAREERCARQLEEDSLFIATGLIWVDLFLFAQIHKETEIFMEKGSLNMEISKNSLLLY